MNTWGMKRKLSIFGESHGEAIGIVMDGLPPGVPLDLDFIRREMARRAPGRSDTSTSRLEPDEVEIVSGVFDSKTTGAPLCGMIRNTNTRSQDYDPGLVRPGHADYTAFVKYQGAADYRGGGHFSGRLTAPLVFAGAIAKTILRCEGITVGAHIKEIHHITDDCFDSVNLRASLLEELSRKAFPVINDSRGEAMQKEILQAKKDHDSVGGVVECGAVGIKAGLGQPFFASAESVIASMMFSIPAVKGIEFGAGFSFAGMTGSEGNDGFYVDNMAVKTHTNHNGGINGGITNGMPLVFRVVIKPTPSIGKEQRTVNINTMENTVIQIQGRHDPCILHRAVPVVEACLALCLLDLT